MGHLDWPDPRGDHIALPPGLRQDSQARLDHAGGVMREAVNRCIVSGESVPFTEATDRPTIALGAMGNEFAMR